MINVTKKFLTATSLCGLVVVLSGCAMMCPQHKQKMAHHRHGQVPEKVVYNKTYNATDENCMYAKMYTRSSRGGESKMGYIKFDENNGGVKMKVDLTDLRPGVVYNVKVKKCNRCMNDANECCGYSTVNADLPTLQISQAGRLQDTYMIQGLTPEHLQNAQVCLERDGGYKAAWGTLKQKNYK